jgi:hypothetical protein
MKKCAGIAFYLHDPACRVDTNIKAVQIHQRVNPPLKDTKAKGLEKLPEARFAQAGLSVSDKARFSRILARG